MLPALTLRATYVARMFTGDGKKSKSVCVVKWTYDYYDKHPTELEGVCDYYDKHPTELEGVCVCRV